MSTYRRISAEQINCFTLTKMGQLEKGIPFSEFREGIVIDGHFVPKLVLLQGVTLQTKEVLYDDQLTATERKAGRLFLAQYYFNVRNGSWRLKGGYSTAVLLYLPSQVSLPFGAPYPDDPLELVCGGVLQHPDNRHRDGHVALGEAWEDDKTGLFRVEPGQKVMVGSRELRNDGVWDTKVVTIVRAPQTVVMRYPNESEMTWFVNTICYIRKEEHQRRSRTEANYRQLIKCAQ